MDLWVIRPLEKMGKYLCSFSKLDLDRVACALTHLLRYVDMDSDLGLTYVVL